VIIAAHVGDSRHPKEVTDWQQWHSAYSIDGPLARRLAAVQEQIRLTLDRAAPGELRVLSLCAGAGRDLLPVLATHPRARDVIGRLVEQDHRLCSAAAAAAPPTITVVCGDAGTTTACIGAAPADLLLLCGIFGNVSDSNIRTTVAAVPSLLAAGGTVVWTRHRGQPDITPRLRAWFDEAGVKETAFITRPGDRWSVGAGLRHAEPEPLSPDERLFTFVR
jgi:hypothetical protein